MDAKAALRVADALDLLGDEHVVIRRHFHDYELTLECPAGLALRAVIAGRICVVCCLHLQLEEEIVYPAARPVLHADALLEHALCDHVGSLELIARLATMQPQDADYDATVAVLAAYILPHMDEEERELFPRLRHSSLDLVSLGLQMSSRHKALQVEFGCPDCGAIGIDISAPIDPSCAIAHATVDGPFDPRSDPELASAQVQQRHVRAARCCDRRGA